jgi:integrase/recombinase XerD
VIHPHVVQFLEVWLTFRGRHPGPLFPALARGGHIQPRPISAHQFWKVFRNRAMQAGFVEPPAPHELRRWFVTSLLDNGTDLLTTMRAVGHVSPMTTAVYDRRGIRRLREAVDRLDIPDTASLEADPDNDDPQPQRSTS